MREHGDVLNNVLRRRDEYEAKQKIRRKRAMKIGSFMICICLLAVISFGIFQGDLLKNTSNVSSEKQYATDTIIPGVTDAVVDDKDNTAQDSPQIIIKLNHIDNVSQISRDAAVCWEDFVSFSQQEAIEYYGTNIYPSLPEDISKFYGYDGVFRDNGGMGEIYFSTFEMGYYSADMSREIIIRGDKEKRPFSCIVYDYDTRELEATVINGENVYFTEFKNGRVFVDFIYNNVYFEITFNGLSDEEMVSVISSLIG